MSIHELGDEHENAVFFSIAIREVRRGNAKLGVEMLDAIVRHIEGLDVANRSTIVNQEILNRARGALMALEAKRTAHRINRRAATRTTLREHIEINVRAAVVVLFDLVAIVEVLGFAAERVRLVMGAFI